MTTKPFEPTGARTHFVGRRSDIQEFNSAVEEAVAGRMSLVLVSGEPGIGKTRLVEEARIHAEKLGAEVVWGRCWSEEGAPPYWPWVQIIRRLAQRLDAETLREQLGSGAADVAQIVPELARKYKGLQSPAVATPEQARFRLFDAVAGLFSRFASRKPLMLVLDDLHAADPSTLLLLRFLAHELTSVSLLLVGTFRDFEVAETSVLNQIIGESIPNRRLMALRGLEPSEVNALIQSAVQGSPSDDFVRVLHDKSGGNPLFVKELLALLSSQGKLDAAVALPTLGLPRGIKEILERRLSRLSSACHKLLSCAAVVGTEFELVVAAGVAGVDRASAIDLLDEAERARLVSSVSPSAQRWRFEHGLVRESLYGSLGTAARLKYHHRAGVTIERVFSANPAGRITELAHHFVRAAALSGPERAIDYSVRAGRLALSRLAYEEAIGHFQDAIDTSGTGRGDLLLLLAEALIGAGGFDEAKRVYEEVAEQARRQKDAQLLAQAALGLGAGLGGFEVTMRDQRQIDLLEEALAALDDEDSKLRAHVMARLSIASAFVASQDRRVELSVAAAQMTDRLGDPAGKAYALSTFCDARSGPEYVDERLQAAEEMIVLARSVDNKEMELLGRRYRVVSLMESGDRAGLDQEIDSYARVAALLRQPLSSWYVPLFRAAVALMEGRLEDCERLAANASNLGNRAQSQNVFWFLNMTMLPELWLKQGRVDQLQAEFVPALQQLRDMTGIDWPAIYAATLGVGSDAAARVELERLAANHMADIPRDGMWLPTMYYLARACVQIQNRRAAEVLYKEVAPFTKRFIVCGIMGACYGVVDHQLGLLAGVLERWQDAERHFDAALRAHASVGALSLLATTHHDFGALLLRMGRRTEAQKLLRAAESMYRDMGMRKLSQQVTKLLDESQATGENVFRRLGEIWTVEFEGKAVTLKDSKGLRDLATLMARPQRGVHVSELLAPDTPRRVAAGGEIPPHAGAGAEILDATAAAQYRSRMQEVQDELDEADKNNDAGRAAKLRGELEFLTAELASAYGLGGRPRKFPNPAERARKAVTGRIKDAISRIAKVHAGLGRHLAHSVKTGTFCSYSPENPVSWSL